MKKMTTVMMSILLVVLMTACNKQPEFAFRKIFDLGYYEGMHITWVKDDAATQATGFYVMDDSHLDKSKPNNKDFEKEKLVGHYGDLNIMWVKDNSDADSKGFYIFRNSVNNGRTV